MVSQRWSPAVDDKLQDALQVDRYTDLIRALLTVGPGSIHLRRVMSPAIVLESDRPEWGWLKSENRFAARLFIAAAVGNFSTMVLENPFRSRVLIVLEAILSTSVAQEVFIRAEEPAALPASVMGVPLDFRSRVAANSIGKVNAVATAALLGTEICAVMIGQTVPKFDIPIIVSPGSRLILCSTLTNVALNASFVWRERVMETTEQGKALG